MWCGHFGLRCVLLVAFIVLSIAPGCAFQPLAGAAASRQGSSTWLCGNGRIGLQPRSNTLSRSGTALFETDGTKDDAKVEVGSKEYLEGFISSPIQDGTVPERGTGLEQALKLGGSVAFALVVLFLGFMASNGLL